MIRLHANSSHSSPPSTKGRAAQPAAMVGMKMLLICCYLELKDSGAGERFAAVCAVRSYFYVDYVLVLKDQCLSFEGGCFEILRREVHAEGDGCMYL